LLCKFVFHLTPQPLSQRERGEKPQEFPYPPSPYRRGG